LTNSLERIANSVVARGKHTAGVLLYAAAEALCRTLRIPLSRREQAECERILTEARAAMDSETVEDLRAEGLQWTGEQAVSYALALLSDA